MERAKTKEYSKLPCTNIEMIETMRIKIAINFISVKEIELASLKKLVEVILDVLFCANEPYKVLVPTFKTIPSPLPLIILVPIKAKLE